MALPIPQPLFLCRRFWAIAWRYGLVLERNNRKRLPGDNFFFYQQAYSNGGYHTLISTLRFLLTSFSKGRMVPFRISTEISSAKSRRRLLFTAKKNWVEAELPPTAYFFVFRYSRIYRVTAGTNQTVRPSKNSYPRVHIREKIQRAD